MLCDHQSCFFEFIGNFSVWISQLSFRPDATAPNSSPLRTVTLNMKVVSNHEWICIFWSRLGTVQGGTLELTRLTVMVVTCRCYLHFGYPEISNKQLSIFLLLVWPWDFQQCSFFTPDIFLITYDQAPAGCGQYFTEPISNISSLNWRDGTYLK